MAKRNREAAAETDDSRFSLGEAGRSITKPKMVPVVISMTEDDANHLNSVAEEVQGGGISRSELIRRFMVFCLKDIGKPLPSAANRRPRRVESED